MLSAVSCGATLARVLSPLSVIWQGAQETNSVTLSSQAARKCSELGQVQNLHNSRVSDCSSYLVAARQ